VTSVGGYWIRDDGPAWRSDAGLDEVTINARTPMWVSTGFSWNGLQIVGLGRDPSGRAMPSQTVNEEAEKKEPQGQTLRPLTECESGTLSPYIPHQDLTDARLYDGVVPRYLPDDYIGITRGNRIYFRPGVYTPSTASGLALLGHELVHVGQYREGATWFSFVSSYANHGYWNSPFEVPARQVEDRIRNDLQSSGRTCGGGAP
jgi:hypothetical protein